MSRRSSDESASSSALKYTAAFQEAAKALANYQAIIADKPVQESFSQLKQKLAETRQTRQQVIDQLVSSYSHISERIKSLQEETDTIRSSLSSEQVSLAPSDIDISSIQSKLKEKEKEIARLEKELENHPAKIQLKERDEEVQQLRKEAEQAAAKFHEEVSNLKILSNQIQPESLRSLELELQNAKVIANEKIQYQQTEIKKLEEALAQRPTEQHVKELQGLLADSRNLAEETKSQHLQEVQSLRDALDARAGPQQVKQLESQLQASLQDSREIKEKLTKEIQQLQTELTQRPTHEDVEELREKNKNIEKKLEELQSYHATELAKLREEKSLLSTQHNQKVEELQRQLMREKEKTDEQQVLLEQERENSSNKIHLGEYEKMKRQVSELNQQLEDQEKSYIAKLEYVQLELADQIDPAELKNLKSEKKELEERCVQLSDEVEALKSVIKNQPGPQRVAELEQELMEVRRLTEKYQLKQEKELQKLCAELAVRPEVEDYEKLQNELEELRKNSNSNSMQTSEVNHSEVELLKQTISNLEKEKEDLQGDLKHIQQTLKKLEEKIRNSPLSSLEIELRAREKELANISERHRHLEEENQLNEHDRKADKEKIIELQNELQAKDAMIFSFQEKMGNLPNSPAKIRQDDPRRELARLKAASSAHQAQNAQLEREIIRIQNHFTVKLNGKDETIANLKDQLDRSREDYQTLRREALVKSGVDDNTVKELDSIAFLKQEYFYSLAIGLKLELSSRGKPCNLNVGELFQEAQYNIPVQQWNSWLSQKFKEESADTKVKQSNGPARSQGRNPHRTERRVNTNSIEM